MTVAPSRLEGLVLSSIRSPEDLSVALRCGVTAEHFVVEVHERAWNYINDRLGEGHEVPSLADLRELGVEVVEGASDVETWSRRLVDEVLGLKINTSLYNLAKQKKVEQDPRNALAELLSDLTRLSEGSGDESRVLYADADAPQLFAEVKERAELQQTGQPVGLATGLPIFDNNGWSWQQGEVIGIMGALGIGKSSLMTYLCAVAYLQGAKVLFLSPESTRQEVVLRSHIYLAHLKNENHTFRLDDMRKGTIDLEQYEEYTTNLAARKDWPVVDSSARGAFSLDEVLQLAREHRPTILAVDGFHLLLPDHGKQARWEQIQEAAIRLKGLANNTGMIVMAVCQVVRDGLQFDDALPEAHQAAYGAKALLEAADRILVMAKYQNQARFKRFGVQKFRNGPDLRGQEKLLEFDPDIGLLKQQ